jgi:hypothetical protein
LCQHTILFQQSKKILSMQIWSIKIIKF